MHRGLSERSLYFRFFTLRPDLGTDFVRQILAASAAFGRALLGELDDRIVGLATYPTLDRPMIAAAAPAADSVQSYGVGTLLLEHLISRARQRGVEIFRAEVVAENSRMVRVFADMGLNEQISRDGTTLTVDISPRYGERPSPMIRGLDVLLVVIAPTALGDLTVALDRIAETSPKPVVAVVLGQPEVVRTHGSLPVSGGPSHSLAAAGRR